MPWHPTSRPSRDRNFQNFFEISGTACPSPIGRRVRWGRAEFDALKAAPHNCARADPRSRNRAMVPDFRADLAGRVSCVEQINPLRGAKLRRLCDRIDWSPRPSRCNDPRPRNGATAQGPERRLRPAGPCGHGPVSMTHEPVYEIDATTVRGEPP